MLVENLDWSLRDLGSDPSSTPSSRVVSHKLLHLSVPLLVPSRVELVTEPEVRGELCRLRTPVPGLRPGSQPEEAGFQAPSGEAALSSTLKLHFIASLHTWLLLAVGSCLPPHP